MHHGNNVITCPKCQEKGTYLVTVKSGKQYVCCKHCSAMLILHVKNGQFTGQVDS
jgi:hypothetical protein